MDQICDSIVSVCQEHGLRFKRQGGELYAPCPFHSDGKRPNFRVNPAKNSWFCDVCGEGGGVVEFIAKKTGRDKKEVFKEFAGKQKEPDITPMGEIVCTYDYTDASGNLLYQVCRMKPKSFRQRRPDGKGGWIWNMEGIERVLYRLPDILNPKCIAVCLVEGEKDADTLRGIRLPATTNVGGAGKWCDAYSETLAGKDVIICGDNDTAGQKHMQKVMEALDGHAKSIRVVQLPKQFKDVSDFAASFSSKEKFSEALQPLVDNAPVVIKGGFLPIKSMAELEQEYREHVEQSRTRLVNLSDWLPSLRCVRSLVGGELVTIVGDTGSAKTYVLQHIAYHCRVPTLLFELELPGSLTFERFVAVVRRKAGQDVFNTYDQGEGLDYSDLSHVYTCTRSRLTPLDIEALILKSELKIGVRPTLVLVDYIQLIQGTTGRSRYERISSIAEDLKIVAKSTNTVIVMASQVGREKEDPEIRLHDAKDSGSIENSSGVVLGIWRDPEDFKTLNMRVLKNTKGRPSDLIRCHIFHESMRIVEKGVVDPADMPDYQPY